MGKLSHIDELEQRGQDWEQEQMQQAQEMLLRTREAQRDARACGQQVPESAAPPAYEQPEQEPDAERFTRYEAQETASGKAQATARTELSAAEEEEFHGLSSTEPLEVGHVALIVIAVALVIVAGVYIANSWLGLF